MKIFLTVLELYNGQDFHISKSHNSIINVGGATVPFLCTSSGGVLYLYKVS